MRVSDFRSDTVTKPSLKMREAMYKAQVGDDVLGDDPTVKKLEKMAAQILKKEAALFVPSGTMGNAISIKVWTSEGDEVIVEEKSHIYSFESGHLAFISRVMPRPLPSERGIFDLELLEKAVNRRRDIHIPPPTLISLENTHNFWGGAVIPLEHFIEVKKIADKYGLKVHLDGARIFNASVATGIAASEYARYADSVMFCLSKGLGAPIGSVVVGTEEFAEKARKIRKLLGGGMRQVGVIASCGIVALQNIGRLKKDHLRAKRLAVGLSEIESIELDPNGVETNMVFFKVRHSKINAFELVSRMKKKGVLAIAMSQDTIRMVTHLDVNDEDVERVLEVVKKILIT